ncbi:MAG: adenylate/guanylate cyclase domain-containing protein [Myxococcales bacterium]|nr:adenylate/guanylate cyclase domain-containing protein [Myxococcales bacterium]
MTRSTSGDGEMRTLRAELEAAKRVRRLIVATDEALEAASRARAPLDRALGRLLPLAAEELGARGMLVRTYDESLALHDFRHGDTEGVDGATFQQALNAGEVPPEVAARETLSMRLDVAGEDFGVALAIFDRALEAGEREALLELLEAWAEVLDNYLDAIAHARQKHRIIQALSDALREPILDRGIALAVKVLAETISVGEMLLVFHHEDDHAGTTLSYKRVRGGEITHDSGAPRDAALHGTLRDEAASFLGGEDSRLLERFGLVDAPEEILINGVRDRRVVGRLVMTNEAREFNTFDRDLLASFADFLRQRIVDFNREWKQLSLCFAPQAVERLLRVEGYAEALLSPQEREVAVLFCDISGFTRISEQVLRRPPLIGALINHWSAAVVQILWETGGVFDKMVGDCVIGLWGPPFFEEEPATLCARALGAAERIRDITKTLNDGVAMPELANLETPIGVATGLNYCPLFVGRFGPNEDYTGFSSGMNNAARLQGVAERDEILCMEEFVSALGLPERFGPPLAAKVKNVAEPLRYRSLRDEEPKG